MMFKYIFSIIMIVLISGFADIVRRHDKDDSDYLALGSEFGAVCKVGKRGGDGTLIGGNWVITAAHVARGMHRRSGGKFQLYFGEKEEAYEVQEIYIHPQFREMQSHDIALIKLEENVAGIAPYDLYLNNDEEGKMITIVGHGDYKNGQEVEWKSDGKKRAATNRVSGTTNDKLIFDFTKPGEDDITALEGTAGRGDSGGPALILIDGSPMVAGISSAGMPGENGPGTYGAVEHYTRVSSHEEWIEEVMAGQLKPTSFENAVVTRRQPRQGVFEGLGLILTNENGRVAIQGKIDQQVPRAFRSVLFRPPSFLSKINDQKITSLEQLRKIMGAVAKGKTYSIEFEVQGKLLDFEITK